MAKIRGIKPETWTDDKFVQLSPLARLLFIGMWNLACDNGHVEDNAVQLKIRLLPMDQADISELVGEMIATGQVERHDGYLKVIKLPEHQQIKGHWLTLCEWCDHDPCNTFSASDRKPVNRGTTTTQPPRNTSATVAQPSELSRGELSRGDGELTRAGKPAKRASQLPDTWKPNDKHRALAAERGVDCDLEAIKMRDWAATKGATGKDWDARFRNWLRDARPALTAFKPDPRVANEPVEFPPDGLTDEEMAAWWSRRRA